MRAGPDLWEPWAGNRPGPPGMIRTLQGLLGVPVTEQQELRKLTLEQLQSLTGDLQEKLRNRTPS
jgi:hypothetical protein